MPHTKGSHSHLLASYIVGLVLSLCLTVIAYTLVVTHQSFDRTFVFVAIAGLALVQLLVQLVFFLHIAQERRPWWKSILFVLAIGVVIIVVFGSLWIMDNLNYHMGHKSSNQVQEYMHRESGL